MTRVTHQAGSLEVVPGFLHPALHRQEEATVHERRGPPRGRNPRCTEEGTRFPLRGVHVSGEGLDPERQFHDAGVFRVGLGVLVQGLPRPLEVPLLKPVADQVLAGDGRGPGPRDGPAVELLGLVQLAHALVFVRQVVQGGRVVGIDPED